MQYLRAPYFERKLCQILAEIPLETLEIAVPATPPSATPSSEGYMLRMGALHRGASASPPLKGGGFPLERWPPDPMGVAQAQLEQPKTDFHEAPEARRTACAVSERDGACKDAISPPVSICEQSFFGHKSAVDIDIVGN
jgi:hypothetical protein